jgi:hypothetical protein
LPNKENEEQKKNKHSWPVEISCRSTLHISAAFGKLDGSLSKINKYFCLLPFCCHGRTLGFHLITYRFIIIIIIII